MSKYPVLDKVLACVADGTHMVERTDFGACEACGEYMSAPTNSWVCNDCGTTVYRFRGEYSADCDCGARYNASGQRLRDDWDRNPSWLYGDVDDMEGYEMQHGGDF